MQDWNKESPSETSLLLFEILVTIETFIHLDSRLFSLEHYM